LCTAFGSRGKFGIALVAAVNGVHCIVDGNLDDRERPGRSVRTELLSKDPVFAGQHRCVVDRVRHRTRGGCVRLHRRQVQRSWQDHLCRGKVADQFLGICPASGFYRFGEGAGRASGNRDEFPEVHPSFRQLQLPVFCIRKTLPHGPARQSDRAA